MTHDFLPKSRGPGRSRIAFTILAVCALVGCDGSPVHSASPVGRPNLVVVTIDTLRADHVGCYGYFRDTTPNIDQLAEESLLFEHCQAPIAQTLPSHMSLFTGLLPHEHGIESNIGLMNASYIPSPKIEMLAQHLQGQGYRTAAFVSADPVGAGTGLEQGFESWSEAPGQQIHAEPTVNKALKWLEAEAEEPYFLWVHLFDPHGGYEPPVPFDEMFTESEEQSTHLADRQFPQRYPRRLKHRSGRNNLVRREHDFYDGEIRYADSQLGRLFDELRGADSWARTALVVTSDHGEGLMQHDSDSHHSLWREQLAVPMLMRIPGVEARRVESAMQNRDFLPTLHGLLPGLPLEEFVQQGTGRDVLANQDDAPPYYALSPPNPLLEAQLGPSYRLVNAVEYQGWRLILDSEDEAKLFHLEVDPFELTDLATEQPERVAEYRALLAKLVEEQMQRRRDLDAGKLGPMDPERLESLRAMGYVGAPVRSESTSESAEAAAPAAATASDE